MANSPLTRRALIDKANTMVVIVVSAATFLTVFSLVATKTLISQAQYQNRVIAAKKEARDTLKNDLDAVKDLKTSYEAFLETTQNVIGGNPEGTGQQDGDNAKIVLDALPSSYDFPALVTSLESLVASQGVSIKSISGIDEEASQAANDASSAPQPVAMPFTLSVSGNYESIQKAISALERSIRPIQLKSVEVAGNQADLTLTIDAQTYYQPAKSLKINTKVVE
ncbi:type 4a pilus biogenesis protein PilO [Candidatus Saccharibacteria bacterium]|nr:type 4a pilus biogenesis protein PilO [Candidatus Saccharibacteria bacterium]